MVCNRTADIRGLKPKLRSSAHRDGSALVSFSQLWAMHVVHPTPPPTAKLTRMTESYITPESITQHTGNLFVLASRLIITDVAEIHWFFFPSAGLGSSRGLFSWALSLRFFSKQEIFIRPVMFLRLRQDSTWFQRPCTLLWITLGKQKFL